MFNEITANAIRKAFEKPMMVNVNLVEAQQARRVLDRLVGYKISPLLWDKVRRGLSAGRVQTVALRLIVEREREIRAFEKKEYWTIDVDLAAKKPPVLTARLAKINGETPEVGNQETADSIVANLAGVRLRRQVGRHAGEEAQSGGAVHHVHLQQESSRKLRFSVKRTMMLAQRLYEGVELGKEGLVGLITYMRTDSTRVSDDALKEAREFIAGERFGPAYLPAAPNVYKSKKDAQDAHEAIRPDVGAAHARGGRAVPGRRRDEAVPADLDAVRGFADDAGGFRPDHDRSLGHRQGQGRVSVPRYRLGAQVRRLPQGLRRGQGPEGRGRRGAEAQAAGGGRGRDAEVPRDQARSSISPSRRRASTKPRW